MFSPLMHTGNQKVITSATVTGPVTVLVFQPPSSNKPWQLIESYPNTTSNNIDRIQQNKENNSYAFVVKFNNPARKGFTVQDVQFQNLNTSGRNWFMGRDRKACVYFHRLSILLRELASHTLIQDIPYFLDKWILLKYETLTQLANSLIRSSNQTTAIPNPISFPCLITEPN